MDEFLLQFAEKWSYWGVALFLWGTGFGCPLPEDVCLLAAGWLCGQDEASLWIMIPLTMFCVLGSDCVIYFLGWRWGRNVTGWWPFRTFLSAEKLARSEELFHLHGGKTLFAVRFMPLVRAPSFFTAGTFKYPFWKFLVFDGLAALISVPTLVLLGWYFADRFAAVKEWARHGQLVMAVGVATLIAAYIGYHVWRHRRAKRTKRDEAAASKSPQARASATE